MRELSYEEGSHAFGAAGLSVCEPLPARLEVLCNILAGDVIANVVGAGVTAFGNAINAQAAANPLPPTIYAPGYGPYDGNPYSSNFVGPPAPGPDIPDEIYSDEGE